MVPRVLKVLVLGVLPLALGAQQQGYLKAKVKPGRAGVFIDGKYLGPAANFRIAQKYAVAEGDHELRLAEPRYEEKTLKVNIRAGKTTTVSETLQPLPLAKPPFGILRVMYPGDKMAAVFINGRFYGHVGEMDNVVEGLKLNPGEYVVKVVARGSDTGQEQTAKIEADKTAILRFTK